MLLALKDHAGRVGGSVASHVRQALARYLTSVNAEPAIDPKHPAALPPVCAKCTQLIHGPHRVERLDNIEQHYHPACMPGPPDPLTESHDPRCACTICRLARLAR